MNNAGDKPVVTQAEDEAAIDVTGAQWVLQSKAQAASDCLADPAYQPTRSHIEGCRNAMHEALEYLNDAQKSLARFEQETLSREGREADPFAAIAEEVRELVEDEEAGFWRPCTGCHETDEGHPTGWFPFSRALNCELGHGCRECGGIGAVWDDTDYADMAEFMAAADRDHENIKRILIENGVKPYPAEMMTMEIRALEIPAALSPPASEGRDGGREAGWLIEGRHLFPDVPHWWHPAKGWVSDANEALRFAREKDAAECAKSMTYGAGGTPTSHVFVAALSTAPASPEQADQADVLRERIAELEAALAKRGAMSVVAGGGQKPYLKITFPRLRDVYDANDALLAAIKAQEG